MRSKIERTSSRWAGSTEDFARLARLARQLVADAGGEDDARLTIKVDLGSQENTFESADEFLAHTTARDLGRIKYLSLVARSLGDADLEAVVAISSNIAGSAVRMIVAGPNQTAVRGISSQLYEATTEGRRPPGFDGQGVGVVLGAIVTFGAMGATIIIDPELPDWTFQTAWGFLAGLALLFGIFAITAGPVAWLSPPVEILASGAQTRWEKSRRALKRAAIALLGIVATAIVAKLVTDLI